MCRLGRWNLSFVAITFLYSVFRDINGCICSIRNSSVVQSPVSKETFSLLCGQMFTLLYRPWARPWIPTSLMGALLQVTLHFLQQVKTFPSPWGIFAEKKGIKCSNTTIWYIVWIYRLSCIDPNPGCYNPLVLLCLRAMYVWLGKEQPHCVAAACGGTHLYRLFATAMKHRSTGRSRLRMCVGLREEEMETERWGGDGIIYACECVFGCVVRG